MELRCTINKVKISSYLLKNTYLVNVFQEGDLVSQGSAFPINEKGDLLTIVCKKPGDKHDVYGCSVLAPFVTLPYFKDPIYIDAAILINSNREKKVDYFKCPEKEVAEGMDVLMCGYSDEIEFPMAFQRNLDFKHPDFAGKEVQFRDAIEANMKLCMVKSGMIGRASKVRFTDANLSGFSIYIDNGFHSGASGGPVVDKHNHVIGIITQRAVTDISSSENPGLKVPSGSTIAISPSLILGCQKVNDKRT